MEKCVAINKLNQILNAEINKMADGVEFQGELLRLPAFVGRFQVPQALVRERDMPEPRDEADKDKSGAFVVHARARHVQMSLHGLSLPR